MSVEINGGSFEATTGLLLPEGSSVKDATITANNTKNMQPAVYAMGDMTIENCIIKAEKSHAVAVAGGAAFFFLKNKKPDSKTKGKTDLDDYDYGVDEDDEYADFEPYEEEGEDA